MMVAFIIVTYTSDVLAWYDEADIPIAKRVGYSKWFNAAGAHMAKTKAETIKESRRARITG